MSEDRKKSAINSKLAAHIAERAMRQGTVEAIAAEIEPLLGQLEMAWIIMANSSNWSDGNGSTGWSEAAEKWREEYFELYRLKDEAPAIDQTHEVQEKVDEVVRSHIQPGMTWSKELKESLTKGIANDLKKLTED